MKLDMQGENALHISTVLVAFSLSTIYSAARHVGSGVLVPENRLSTPRQSERALNLAIGARFLFQPDATVIDELDAGRLEGCADGGKIVLARCAATLFEVDYNSARHSGASSQHILIHVQQRACRSALFW